MTEEQIWSDPSGLWISTDQVIHFSGLKPQHLNLDKTDDYTLHSILADWIKQAQSLILSYCHIRTLNCLAVSDAMKNVCLRLTANMVALSIARRDTPITQPNDWTVQILSSEIFTKDLKADLEPYVNASVTGKSDKITVFTVTGEDII